MTDATEATGRDSLRSTGSPMLGGIRLAIGLAQGAALWWLYQSAEALTMQRSAEALLASHGSTAVEPASASWPATVPELFGPLALILVMVPVLLLAGVGRMRLRILLLWALGATAFLGLLGWHGVAAQFVTEWGSRGRPPFLPWPMPLFAAAALFIGHHLVLAADLERRWIAAYPTYFDTAWKAGVQLALSIGFTLAFWLLLVLGGALFRVIGLTFLGDLMRQDWFAIPVTTLIFAVAAHLTDVRDGLIRGVRSVALMLLSWLLLLMTVLAAGFLAALPFTGLEGLWSTRSATALVLAAAAALIILINTAYQDGRADNRPPVILRATARLAAVLLTPLVLLAFWGLALRIGQHGLTPERIIALACALIGAAYAGGYGFAALPSFWRKDAGWMMPLERTNVLTAVLEIAIILALFSPVADPARLSVADQVARLERREVTPDRFDYRFLQWQSGEAGRAALRRLTRSEDSQIAARARAAQRDDRHVARAEAAPAPPVESLRIRVRPAGTALPASFRAQFERLPSLRRCNQGCEARMVDLDRDGDAEVLVAGATYISVFRREADGLWFERAVHRASTCEGSPPDLGSALAADGVTAAAPALPDLTVGGVRLRQEPGAPVCPAPSDPVTPVAPAP